MIRIRLVLAAVLVLVGAGCSASSELPTDDTAIQAIREANQVMSAAAKRADWDTWASWFAEDALVLVPNRPALEGRRAIREFANAWPPIVDDGTDLLELLEIEVRDDLSYVRGRYRLAMRMPDGRVVTDSGKTLNIWRKQTDGSWKLSRDMSSSDVPISRAP